MPLAQPAQSLTDLALGVVVLALARLGHDELGWGDPMRWVAERA